MRVMDLAFAFRQAFHKDVVVDLVCYRRFGHNEADEPAFTQPRMYALIETHPSVRERYTEQLVQRGDLSADEVDAAVADFRARLDRAFEETHEPHDESADTDATSGAADAVSGPVTTAVAALGARPGRHRAHDLARDVPRQPEAGAAAARPPERVRRRDARLVARRGRGVRVAAPRGDPGAGRGPGHPPGHVQPAPRGARRRRRRVRVRPVEPPGRRPGAVPPLRLGAVGVRGARLRVRLLGRGARGAHRLGGPVRRLRERRAGHDRRVRRCRPGQVGSDVRADLAVAARLRGAGRRPLERAARAVPHPLRRRQHPGRVPVDRGAVLPRAAPPGPHPAAGAAGVPHPEAVPAPGAHPLTGRGVHPRPLPPRARRPRHRPRRRRGATGAGLLREARATS